MSSHPNLEVQPRWKQFRGFIWSFLFVTVLIPLLDIFFNDYWDTVDINHLTKGILAAGILYLLLLGGLFVLTLFVNRKISVFLKLTKYLEPIYQFNKKLALLFSSLGVSLLTVLVGIAYFEQPLPDTQALRLFFYSYGWFHHFFYLAGIGLLAAIIFSALDCKMYRAAQQSASYGDSFSPIELILIVNVQLIMTIVTIFLILSLILIGLNLPFSDVFGSWFLQLRQSYSVLPLIKLLVTFAALFFAIVAIIRIKMNRWLRLGLLVVMGIVLQFTFPLFENGSLARIEYQVSHFGSWNYIDVTCSNQNLADVFANYDALSKNNKWLATKPQGYLAPYFGLKRMIGAVAPEIYQSRVLCKPAFYNTLTYFSPFISILALIPIYLLSRYFYSPERRYLPILIFILLPNFILFTGVADQLFVLIPFLFFVLVSWIMVEKRSFFWAGIVGLGYYLCLSYSLSLLGILSIPLFMLGLKYFQGKKLERIERFVFLGMAVIGTVVLVEFVVQLVFEYNTLEMIQRALNSHRDQINLRPQNRKYVPYLLASNLEYVLFVGPPAVLLFMFGILFKTTSHQPKRESSKFNIVLVFVLFYMLLNIIGQNKGETARLWLFLNPLLALTTPIFFQDIDEKKQKWVLAGFIFLQLSLMFLFNHTFFDMFQNGIDVFSPV